VGDFNEMKYECIKSGGLRRYPASTSAGALSLTTILGLPRSIASRSSSRATWMPESDVSATGARHWRVQSSTTGQDAEAAAVGELIRHKVERSPSFGVIGTSRKIHR